MWRRRDKEKGRGIERESGIGWEGIRREEVQQEEREIRREGGKEGEKKEESEKE